MKATQLGSSSDGAITFLDLAEEVLRSAPAPLTFQKVWEEAVARGVDKRVGSTGKTPWNSLGAQLFVDVRDNPKSKFLKVGKRPARFFLRSRSAELPRDEATPGADEGPAPAGIPAERDLHPVLTYFAASPSFNRGRSIFTKTIYHETSKKHVLSEWTHPDIVGFSIPLDDWESEVLALNEVIDRDALTRFSFEMKRELTRSSYREAFFQAVSNSSWAHQGYLVTASVTQDDELLRELDRLASSFGIGIIVLDLENPGESNVLYPARVRTNLDWETINKLCDQNKDFRKFLESVAIDTRAGKIHAAEYDEVKQDIGAYVASVATHSKGRK